MNKLMIFTSNGTEFIGQTTDYEEAVEAQKKFLEKGNLVWIISTNHEEDEKSTGE